MKCLRHVPYASWRLTVYRQLFTPGSVPNRLPPNPRRTISSTTQSQAPHEQQTTTQTEQSNNDQPEPPAPRPSDQLPRSPLLTNPHVVPVTKRKKRLPTAEDLNALQHNPWAQALASPTRMCSVTGARTPRDLLTTWGLVQRPDSDGLWFLPVGLLKDELKNELKEPPKSTDGQDTASDPSAQEPRVPSRTRSLRHLSLRIMDSIQLLRRLSASLTSHEIGKLSPLTKTIPHRLKHPQGPLTSRDERSLVWRQDMPEFVLGRLRSEVVNRLKKVSVRWGQKLDRKNKVWRVVGIEGAVSESTLLKGLENMEPMKRMECGAVLVLGEPQSEQNALPRRVTLPQTGSQVPVFDLSRLFSESEREELRAYNPMYQEAALFFRPNSPTTVDTMLTLWKLQGFLNEDLEFL
ncbi:hypothetical protein P170DRAFT_507439 [Aspergillus steynii IBT 23096]|uniref:Required for respiratory growth protein 8, mitochondrial n=1 Tax=Aspergillus steynii IBT 23096 TaxID=1392250 RepID=A0A2I2GIM2_9EURO|nr:uncharacterized protein P170DRAFT_507439 [Aspergillus steynii IBT 23096]PLB52687.1 hypothetical protein P170DRAFT_507439 [Aspergillus steynii IBT 23096]